MALPLRLLSPRLQNRLLQGHSGLPLFAFAIGLAITIYVGVVLQQNEIRSRTSSLNTDAKEYSKQLEMVMLNSTLRVQSMLDLYGPNGVKIVLQKTVIEQILSHTMFQRISLFKWTSVSNDGLPELKRIFYSRFPGDNLPLPQKPILTSDHLRSKIDAMRAAGKENAFTINHSEFGDTLHLIWHSTFSPNEYALFSVPLKEAFSTFTTNPDLSAVLSDEDTGLTLVVTWDDNGQIAIVSDPAHVEKHLSDSQDLFMAEGRTDLSSIKLTWIANPDRSISPLTWSVWIAGILISILISLLFQFVIDQNRKVADLVVKRTVDLESALDDATEANLGKTRFLANMSHELRTPLNIIIGMIDILDEKTKDPEILEFLKNIRVSGNQLLTLITDLLNMAQDSDSSDADIVIKNVPIRCPLFFEEIARQVAPDAHKKGLEFRFRISPDVPAYFRGDPARVRQILMNLLRNSIKYTTKGFVELDVATVAKIGSDKVTLRMSVKDSGVGIPASKHKQIFDRFIQLESAKVLGQGGVGLGLSIVKDLVEKMNGSIAVESEIQQGSTFTVDLDFAMMSPETWLQSLNAAQHSALVVAVLSRNLDTVSEIRNILVGDRVQVVNIQDFAKINLHDFTHIIIDSQNVDVPEDWPLDQLKGRVIWLTSPLTQDKNSSLKKTKVVDRSPLLPTALWLAVGVKAVAGKMKNPTRPNLPEGNMAKAPKKDLNILIADDDLANRHLFAAYFSDFGWNLTFTENGQEALDSYRNMPPDVVVADLRMPVMDGLELTDRVRAYEAAKDLKKVPIILVTADALDDTADTARKHGVTTFLTKPIRKAKIVDAIVSATKA